MELDKRVRDKLRQAAEMACLSRHVYDIDASVPHGWKVSDVSSAKVEKKTGFFAALYERTDPKDGEKKYVVAFRGTTPKLPTIFADVNIALGRLPRGQYEAALDFVQQVCEKNNLNPAELELTGHSLGGYLAKEIGTAMGVKKVSSFNAPGASKQVQEHSASLSEGAQKPEEVNVGSSYDIINAFKLSGMDGKGVTNITIDTCGYIIHHSLDGLIRDMVATFNNKPIATPKLGASPVKISNFLSGKMVQSGIVGRVIDTVLSHGHCKTSPKAKPSGLVR